MKKYIVFTNICAVLGILVGIYAENLNWGDWYIDVYVYSVGAICLTILYTLKHKKI